MAMLSGKWESAHQGLQLLLHLDSVVISRLLARAAKHTLHTSGVAASKGGAHLMRRHAQLAMLEPPHEMVKQSSGMRKE